MCITVVQMVPTVENGGRRLLNGESWGCLCLSKTERRRNKGVDSGCDRRFGGELVSRRGLSPVMVYEEGEVLFFSFFLFTERVSGSEVSETLNEIG